MLPYLRFIFSDNDAERIDSSSIVIENLPMTNTFRLGMQIRLKTSQGGAPQIRPLFPGRMRFIVDTNSPGQIPDLRSVQFTDAAYSSWKVIGILLIEEVSKEVGRDLSQLAPYFPVKPNRIWYSPVRCSKDFLFKTVCGIESESLPKGLIIQEDGRRVTNEAWKRYALVNFLKGTYMPELRPKADLTTYHGITLDMPVAEPSSANEYTIIIATARGQKPNDASDSSWDPGIKNAREREKLRLDPSHPRNGPIPARLVYQAFGAEMVPPGNEAAARVRDTVILPLSGPPEDLHYIRFTRTWKPVADCSVYFPQQTIRFEDTNGNNVGERVLPAHGILFLEDQFITSLPETVLNLMSGEMRWLLWVNDIWRHKGQTIPVPINPLSNDVHIVCRLPMQKAMLADKTRPSPGGFSCTYLSLRRTVRAWVDNRIAGGRLNFGVNRTGPNTRTLIRDAFLIANQDPEWQRLNKRVNVQAIANNAPDPFGEPNLMAPRLIPVLEAFFSENAPQQTIPNPSPNLEVYTKGRMAYALWQSIPEEFTENSTQRNFQLEHLGRGGPGAAVALELATFALNPVRRQGENDTDFLTRVHTAILQNLEAGDLLQLWWDVADYESLSRRQFAIPSGHSPIFLSYQGPAIQPNRFIIIDQFGESRYKIQSQPLVRVGDPDIWIAANWLE